MKPRTRTGVVAAAAAVTALGLAMVVPPATASGPGRPTAKVITSGLDGPFGLQAVGHRGFVVAESVTGEVTKVGRHGHQRVLFDGAGGVAGVAAGHGKVFAVLGGPNEDGSPPASDYPTSSLLRSNANGSHVKMIADLAQYELDNNPDGQAQFDENGVPYDALSNPFSMTLSRHGLLVADGGANDVLRVNPRTGHISTFFVPRTVTGVPACLAADAQANPGTVGCDPVPTGVTVARGSVYVSTLGAEVPGAGRVYKLNPRTGRVQHVWKGLTAPTGVAVTPAGTIYVSEVEYGAPQGDAAPPADFDPSTVGRITKISHGHRTHAQVTMPTGLDYAHGRLYASAWSIASFLGIQHAGQIVRVNQRAFH